MFIGKGYFFRIFFEWVVVAASNQAILVNLTGYSWWIIIVAKSTDTAQPHNSCDPVRKSVDTGGDFDHRKFDQGVKTCSIGSIHHDIP